MRCLLAARSPPRRVAILLACHHLGRTLDEEASAFLMPLRALAREGDFAAIAAAMRDGNHRNAVLGYLRLRLFALILSDYPPFLEDPVRASAWQRAEGKKWSGAIASDASDARRFPGRVDAMLADLRERRAGRSEE